MSCIYVISDLNGEKIDVMFYLEELQKTNQMEFSFKNNKEERR